MRAQALHEAVNKGGGGDAPKIAKSNYLLPPNSYLLTPTLSLRRKPNGGMLYCGTGECHEAEHNSM
jgi:hypothetical protein